MAQVLLDGTGRNYAAKVDSEHRLFVRADMIPHPQHHSMTHKNLFLLSFHLVLSDGNESNLAFFKNLDSDIDFEFYITQIGADGDVTARFYFDDEYSSGGAVVTPVNMNRGSGINVSTNRAQIYHGNTANDLVLDDTNRAHFHTMYIQSRMQDQINFQGGLIVTNGKTCSATIQGTAGTKVHLLVMASYHNSGTEL